MFKQLRSYLAHLRKGPIPAYRPINRAPACRLVMTEASVSAIRDCLASEIAKGHEGISYLFGLTNGATTIVVGATRPDARTTAGSFNVTSVAMARVVRAATDAGLQIIGQIHTHPGKAYHSDGDNAGARIAYDGYVSIVVPEYGRRLPSLGGAAIYFYRGGAFSAMSARAVRIITGRF
jgi:proteasome lid subunit RPN8/RPN11